MDYIDEAKSRAVSERATCRILGLNRKTISTWRRTDGLYDKRKGSARYVSHRLSADEKTLIVATVNLPRFRDCPPAQIVAMLAGEGAYIGSESTIRRVMRLNKLLSFREERKAPIESRKIERIAVTGPNQVWSWDITWLTTDVRGKFLYAYTIIDIYDRAIIGWTIEDCESDNHSKRLFERVIRDLKVTPEIVHADNGHPMRGVTLAVFLDSLLVTRSYSRPRVSNDNAFIESWHRTLKYTVGYPKSFPTIEFARSWYADFVAWYNNDHLHSGLGYVTPMERRKGLSEAIYAKRNKTIALAREKNPLRWRNQSIKTYGSLSVASVYRPLSKTA